MHTLAGWLEQLFAEARRLRPRDVVAEFDKYLHDELDLMREAANAAQLRRNMEPLGLVLIPEMFWDWTRPNVLTMERMHGVPVNDVARLRAAGVDIGRLARDGVTIFFTQVFRDGFFHADMHPGNIMVSVDKEALGKYISLEAKIAKNKDLYYEALGASQHDWHEGCDDSVPFIKYLLGTILAAYRDFADRFALVEKKLPALETVRLAVQQKIGRFTTQDIRELCPTLSLSSVEGALRKMVADGEIKREGAGKNTQYIRV
jgi:hypothetical protein